MSNIFKNIQNDLNNSKAMIINNNDNTSFIQENVNSKYTDDISDSDDELSSYRNRNTKLINKLTKKNNKIVDDNAINKEDKKDIQKNKSNKNGEVKKDIQKNKSNKKEETQIIEEVDIEDKIEDEKETNDEEENESDEEDYEYTEELSKKVREYVKDDNRIRELKEELKNLNNGKKKAEGEILKHLERLGESNINITGGKLRVNQYESKSSMKEDIIKKVLGNKIKDPKIIEAIMDDIETERVNDAKIQISLKRTFERGKNNDEKK